MRKIAAARSKYRRNKWYMAFRFNPDRDTIISHRDDDEHARLKLKLAPGVCYELSKPVQCYKNPLAETTDV